jgi:hypothetical protein
MTGFAIPLVGQAQARCMSAPGLKFSGSKGASSGSLSPPSGKGS